MEPARKFTIALASLGAIGCANVAFAQWVTFQNQTSTRLVITTPDIAGDPIGVTTDNQEKDFAWADFDEDGWIDLINVRKQPFTSGGRRRNLLLMNESGVLTDRTQQYATATDVPGDNGFYTQTNDRDVVVADFNGDGWMDFVTATTISMSSPGNPLPKVLSYPRIYINLGNDGNGDWLGFRFESNRIPVMDNVPNAANGNPSDPRFCSVAAGDVTGDGYPDLYFGDYDASGFSGNSLPETYDYQNRILINLGAANPGYFQDVSSAADGRMTSTMLLSAFGAASVIADMNGDRIQDVVKQTSLNPPQHVAVTYNSPTNVGFFNTYKQIFPALAPYFVSVGDLNNDGRLDMVITDDNTDHYHLNQGNAVDGTANFNNMNFSGDDGFGSQSLIVDLNNDGWRDVLISDVDVDIGTLGRRLHIYRNLGNAPNVTLTEQTVGGLGNSSANNSSTYHTAVFDIDNDGWNDLVLGRSTGTFVWMNVPPAGLSFAYPTGLPGSLPVNETFEFNVQVSGIGTGTPVANSGQQFVQIGDGAFVQSAMTPLGGNLYRITLPAVPCSTKVSFYVTAQLTGGGTVSDPPGAPAGGVNFAVASEGQEVAIDDHIEGDTSAWAVTSSGLTSGAWQAATPNGTIFAGNTPAAPDQDADGATDLTMAFVTENGPPGGADSANDVDGGPTRLVSPVIDLDGTDGTVSYQRWFFCNDAGNPAEADFLTVEVSNDNGANWVLVESVPGTAGVNNAWRNHSFLVGDYVVPTGQVRVRFSTQDTPNNSTTEAGIDAFHVDRYICPTTTPCPGDIAPVGKPDGTVGPGDLGQLLASWGRCGGCAADIAPVGAPDGIVGPGDLGQLLASWGQCK